MFKWFRNLVTKSTTSDAIVREFMMTGNVSNWTGHDYRSLAIAGYKKNVIAYTCITSIANAAADVPIIIKIDGEEIDLDTASAATKIAKKILRPNPKQSYKTFMQTAISHRLIGGNTYIHILKTLNNDLAELTLLRPDNVTIRTDGHNVPISYEYNANGSVSFFPIDRLTTLSDVLQIKTFNPLDDLYGLSPLSAAQMSVDQHNQAGEWNKNLLSNSSKISGFISMVDRNDNAPALSVEQLEKIKGMVNEKLTGPANAGTMPVFNYDMKFNGMSLSPVDMDWLNGKQSSARDIAMAFNYPAFLLGFPDASTFSNVDSAKLSLYESNVIPLLNLMLAEWSSWLSIQLGIDIEIEPDLDKVSALSIRRDSARNNARLDFGAGIITLNEAREEVDYEDVPGGDEILVPAGKLPLNFDLGSLDQQKFAAWLQGEGHTKADALELARVAFTKEQQ